MYNFCNSVIFVSIEMVFSLLSRALAGVSRVPTTNRTNVTFIFDTFFSLLDRSKYFSIFSTSLLSTLMSYGIAKSIIWDSWCFLSIVIKWSVCTVKYQKILHKSFSMIASSQCSYHFGLTWIPFTLQIFQWIRLPIQSCLLLYSF